MNRATVRTAAAVLAAAITLSGLKGIAVLAEIESSAALPVVVLPRVIVTAPALDPESRIAATTDTTGGRM